jgi:septal ring factor EnvC (AmiA/AmiB activator)
MSKGTDNLPRGPIRSRKDEEQMDRRTSSTEAQTETKKVQILINIFIEKLNRIEAEITEIKEDLSMIDGRTQDIEASIEAVGDNVQYYGERLLP